MTNRSSEVTFTKTLDASIEVQLGCSASVGKFFSGEGGFSTGHEWALKAGQLLFPKVTKLFLSKL